MIKSNIIDNLWAKCGDALRIPVLLSLAFLVILFIPSIIKAASEPLIKMIEIRGNEKISSGTIQLKMESREGERFSKDTVKGDIKNLYKIGYFDDIRVEIELFEGGVKLIYTFIEKPTVISLDFQGNKKYETKDLKEKITISSGVIANMSLMLDNRDKIIAFYQSEGYWLVTVLPIIKEISQDAVALTYQINEGPKVSIQSVDIVGNSAVPDKDIKKVLKTKKKWFLSFLTGSGTYRRDQMNEDIERIRQLYHSNGYLYVSISEPAISLNTEKKKLSVSLSISEGDQYRFGTIDVTGNTVFSSGELLDQTEISSGQIFNRSALRADIDKIIDLYMERGYARADINPLININLEEKLGNVTLSVSEGKIFKVGRIDVTGNTKTRDKVVRREMRLDEGDIFNKKLLQRSYQRINNLNFFEQVDINPVPRIEEQRIDLDIKVKEKLTGMLSFGGGYSSIDKLMVMGEITQTNLFGKGLYLKLKADLSSRRTNYSLSLRDPWFMDKPISASIGVYNEKVEYPEYDKKATGGFIGFGKEFSEYVGGKIAYTIEKARITDVADDAALIIKDQEGERLTSSISPSIWRDTRDNFIDTTRGSKLALYTTVAGLGGDNYFIRSLADSVWYFPSFLNTTFSIRGRVGYATGYAGKDLPLYERFYVGGINTIRGLDFGAGGPIDENGEYIGGDLEAILNLEWIFPISKDVGLKGVLFFDYGGAFDTESDISYDDVRYTTGFGARWLSPFGPIRLEWGFNLDPREDEKDSKIEFSMGGLF